MSKLVTVGLASKSLGVSVDTIRRWHKKGLIKATRNNHNHRYFNLSEINRVHQKLTGHSSKNRYRILKTNNDTSYTCIELFAGAGGTALGLENAGIKHQLLVENDKDCLKTLSENKPAWNIIKDDISNVSFKGLNADIVQGGFPCQAFSYAGKSAGFDDIRGTLFFEFARCVNEVRPKIAMAENVKGLEKHDTGRTLRVMLQTLTTMGYKTTYKILRSQYLDVPQKRERLIIIAIRNDLNTTFVLPREKDYIISLREAIGDYPQAQGQKYTSKKFKIMQQIPPGGCWRNLPVKQQEEYMGKSYFNNLGGRTGMARRLSWDEPSLTLTCNPAQKQTERCHPDQTRPLNIREYARLQTFPDNWNFVGSLASQYRQIGNAVPVNLGYHLGKSLIAMLNGKIDDQLEIIKPNKYNSQLDFMII